MPTTIYSTALTTNTGGYGGKTCRSEVPITGGAQGQVRVTFAAPVANNLTILNAAIGISAQDATGSTTATPVELLFSGGHGFNITGGNSITSDWVNLSGFTSSDKLIVIVDVDGGGAGEVSYVLANIEYEKAATASYNVQTVAGYSSIGATIGFNLIETQSAGGASPIIPPPMDNPQRQQRSIAFYRHIDYMVLNMQDTFFGPPGMGEPNNDWPVPRGAKRPIDLITFLQSPPLALTVAPALPPNCSTDRPNPRGAAYPQMLRTFVNQVNLNLIGKDTFFGAPGQPPSPVTWINPRGAARPSFGALHIPVQRGALTLPPPPPSTRASLTALSIGIKIGLP